MRLCSQRRGYRFNPWLGKILQAAAKKQNNTTIFIVIITHIPEKSPFQEWLIHCVFYSNCTTTITNSGTFLSPPKRKCDPLPLYTATINLCFLYRFAYSEYFILHTKCGLLFLALLCTLNECHVLGILQSILRVKFPNQLVCDSSGILSRSSHQHKETDHLQNC